MPADLSSDLSRIRRHVPCLERAARDESADPAVRAAAVVELAAWRMAETLATPSPDTTTRGAHDGRLA